MRSIPYKPVISSYSVYNKTQVLTLSILKAKLDQSTNDYRIANKGSIKLEFLPCIDNPSFPGRKKLVVDGKIETYIGEQTIFEILALNSTNLEFKNYYQEMVRFEVDKNGHEWKIYKNNEKRSVLLNTSEKAIVYDMLEVIYK
jgi:hypothetical protein